MSDAEDAAMAENHITDAMQLDAIEVPDDGMELERAAATPLDGGAAAVTDAEEEVHPSANAQRASPGTAPSRGKSPHNQGAGCGSS